MNNIMVLQDNIINQIAAGEVVERPASVVKELAENSIDAGSTAITIETKDGGLTYIKIIDNGKGIEPEEMATAFMRHATSKIRDMDDLEKVLTLGFRGEALSSIASVAQVEMISKTANNLSAKKLEISGGKIQSEQSVGAADGTTIVVSNIFFNTPARRKFLKKPGTESGYVSDVVNKLALGRPEVAFRYIANGTNLLNTNGSGNLKTVIYNIYGKEVARALLNVEYEIDGCMAKGFICKPEISRGNRTLENLFINGRFVKSDIVNSAVEHAYKNRIMAGKFPVFVLNLTLDPRLVDVNVHPTKLEVRFGDEGKIYNLFYEAAIKALSQVNLIPVVEINKVVPKEEKTEIVSYSAEYNYQIDKPTEAFSNYSSGQKMYSVDMINTMNYLYHDDKKMLVVEESAPVMNYHIEKEKLPFFRHYNIVGQFFGTYWAVEQGETLYLIDQHAAHERVLFEKLLKQFTEKETLTQRLVQPLVINLSHSEKNTLEENMELFQSFGFEIEKFDDETYGLKGVPFVFKDPATPRFFMDIIDGLSQISQKNDNLYDDKADAIATMSCKAAVKGNSRLSYIEAKSLIDSLLKLENPFTCPHGRPTIVKLSKYEIEKMFKRIT